MRFIRKGGRVIPIKDEGDDSKPRGIKSSGGYHKQAVAGVLTGAVGGTGVLAEHLGAKAGNIKAMKFGARARNTAAIAGIASTVAALKKGSDVSRETGSTTQGAKEFAKQKGANLFGHFAGGTAVGSVAGYRVLKGIKKRAQVARSKKIP